MKNLHARLLESAVTNLGGTGREQLKDAQIFVTGGTGFLAANLLAFLSRMDRVLGLDLSLAASARRPATHIPLFDFLGENPEVNWQQAAAEKTSLPQGSWIVVHAASPGAPKDYLANPIETYSANVHGLLNLFRQPERIRQFVFVSSAEIYGQAPAACIPTSEDHFGGSQTLSMRSIYGESKRMAEVLGACLARQHNIPFTALRPWNVYGPGQRIDDGRVPMEFVRQAQTVERISLSSNGSPTRSFCYVWDSIKQIVSTLGTPGKSIIAYNIGNGSSEMSVLDLARAVASTCGLPDGSVDYNKSAYTDALDRCVPDVTRITALESGGYEFTPLETGIRSLVEWYQYRSPHD